MTKHPGTFCSNGLRTALGWLVMCLLLGQLPAQAAPLVEIREPRVWMSLSPYVDILEDPGGQLTIQDVMSDRYAFQFAPAPVTELFFGYTSSVYWVRFTIENQRADAMAFILEAAPPDVDYIDLYTVDPLNRTLHRHKRTGSAMPYTEREYDNPLYLFDLALPANTLNTYYIRLASNKTLNLELSLGTPHEYFRFAAEKLWWQALFLGCLLVLGFLYLGLFAVYRQKAFLWYGLFLFSLLAIQISWNGYLLQFFATHESLLDRQVTSPVYLSILFSALFAQQILETRRRLPWQHRILDLIATTCLAGSIVTWFVDASPNALVASSVAIVASIFIFGFTLHANMEGHGPARHFLLARTMTTGIILVAIFNMHGYLPQGSFVAWGVTAAVVLEALILAISLSRFQAQRIRDLRTPSTAPDPASQRSLVNLSDICHELRTPISGVLGMADLLLDSKLSEQQKNQLKTIKKSGQSLLDVANKLSALSQIERGHMELATSLFELNPLIEFCVDSCRDHAEAGKVEFIFHIDKQVSGHYKGDPDKLQQTLANLLHFALHRLEQGEIVLSVSPEDGGKLFFRIRSGHNILMEHTKAADTRPLGPSENLNIIIAEHYITLMGGQLSLHRSIDGSATISFSIPLELQQQPTPARPGDIALLHGRKMLIVDDNATCCAITEQQAMQWGMSVQSAHGGKEALAILRASTTIESPFDIVLVDYDMPGMNGLELAEHICQDRNINHENLHIIMLTGMSRAPEPIAGNRNIRRVLYKPLSGQSLKQALQGVLAEHSIVRS